MYQCRCSVFPRITNHNIDHHFQMIDFSGNQIRSLEGLSGHEFLASIDMEGNEVSHSNAHKSSSNNEVSHSNAHKSSSNNEVSHSNAHNSSSNKYTTIRYHVCLYCSINYYWHLFYIF